jgi:hypothetical protein
LNDSHDNENGEAGFAEFTRAGEEPQEVAVEKATTEMETEK